MEAEELNQAKLDGDGKGPFLKALYSPRKAQIVPVGELLMLYPSFLSPVSPWQQEDLEIAESYADEDWRFMEWLETQLDAIEDGWDAVEERLVRRSADREKRRRRRTNR